MGGAPLARRRGVCKPGASRMHFLCIRMCGERAMEERIAWLERELADLSAVVARQDGELRALRARVDRLTAAERVRAEEGSGGTLLDDERPPHW